MPIAYLTTDEVNKNLALRLAAQREMTVYPVKSRDLPPDGEFDAVLCDWDHWPANRRPKALTQLSAGPIRHPAALHGYGVDQEKAPTLRRRGS
jgi:hypothetical protein